MSALKAILEPVLVVWVCIAPFAGAIYGYNRGYRDAWKRINTLRGHE